MTVTTSAPSGGGEAAVPPEDLVSLTIDGAEISVPKGTLVIRAAEQLGIEIPDSATIRCSTRPAPAAGAVRRGRGPAQAHGVLHDHVYGRNGGEDSPHLTHRKGPARCDGAAAHQPSAGLPGLRQGRRVPAAEPGDVARQRRVRFEGKKRTYEKPVPISTQVLLDRERCVLCARCTRFSNQIAGDPMIELIERGALQQVGTGEGDPFESYFSGNTIQICPVALTSAAYRFRSRPFDLVSSHSVLSAARAAARPAPTTGAARSCGAWPARPRGEQGSGSATRGGSGSGTRSSGTGSRHPSYGASRVNWSPLRGPRPWRRRPGACRRPAAGPAS